MRLRINGYVQGKAHRGEIFEEENEDFISIDGALAQYRKLYPGCTSIRIKVSNLKEE